MRLIDQIIDEVYKRENLKPHRTTTYLMRIIARKYVKAILIRAADNARMETVFTESGERTTINKESILNTKLD